jgi:hypothetical protein
VGLDCTSNKHNKTTATVVEYLNFLKATMVDGSGEGRLRPKNGMSALFLYRKETVLNGLLLLERTDCIVKG